ncbi:MAG: ABATE domain-containing protein [Candidatus Sulfotelmatobacter sp.]
MKERNIQQTTKASERRPLQFDLCGGALCLDFINTLDDRYSNEPEELIKSYIDLARFAEDAEVLPRQQADRLCAESIATPERAEKVLAAAIEMREAMYAVFWALVRKTTVTSSALLVLNRYIQSAAQHESLIRQGPRFEWRFDASPRDLEAPLWPIARSAAKLLASDHLQFVRACASKTCEWLFLDESKNHRRRWCDMTKCGNRAKVRRFYKRKKAEE